MLLLLRDKPSVSVVDSLWFEYFDSQLDVSVDELYDKGALLFFKDPPAKLLVCQRLSCGRTIRSRCNPRQVRENMSQQATVDRTAGLALLASLISGLIAGIGARIIMRIVALTAHLLPQFNIGGTLNVVFLGLFLGFIAGFVYTLCIIAFSNWPKTSKYVPGPLWRGPVFGVLLLLILLPILLGPSSPTDDINLGIPMLNRCMFAALPIIYGLVLGGAEKILDHSLARKPLSLTTEVADPQSSQE